MAYNSANLSMSQSPITVLNTYVWDYTTSDNLSALTSGYFDGEARFRTGDFIRVTANDGNATYRVSTMNVPASSAVPTYQFWS